LPTKVAPAQFFYADDVPGWPICACLVTLKAAMNKTEIAAALRQEVGELEVSINKLQARCEKLKRFVLDLEEEITPVVPDPMLMAEDSTFRKVVDTVFGEKPKRRKR
jgi:hypothetical protein